MSDSGEEIRITAHIAPNRPNACRFSVDRPVYEGSAYFWSADSVKDSPLAAALLGLGDVLGVRISRHDVVVTRAGADDWRAFSAKVASAIRAQIRSGKPGVGARFAPDIKAQTEIKNKVQLIFDTQINPAVASHGGHVELVDVKDHRIYLKMGGGCQGCAGAAQTLRQGIEVTVREQLPEIEEILDVTDHAAGGNPYYEAAAQG